ncbi:hypothetical protein ACEF06_25870 [Brevibacillus agri]
MKLTSKSILVASLTVLLVTSVTSITTAKKSEVALEIAGVTFTEREIEAKLRESKENSELSAQKDLALMENPQIVPEDIGQYSWGTYTNPVKLSFTNGGNKQMYSNNPEPILGSYLNGVGATILENKLVANELYTSELYHHNNTSLNGVIFGVAIKNNNSYNANITVYGNKIDYTTNNYPSMAASVQTAVLNSSESTKYTIYPGSTKVILSKAVPNQAVVDGVVNFKAHEPNMVARHFVLAPGTPEHKIFSTKILTSSDLEKYNSKMTTATLPNNTHISIIDGESYLSKRSYSYIFGFPSTGNKDEYEPAITSTSNLIGSNILSGNYGHRYILAIRDVAGKKLRVTANVNTSGCTNVPANLVYSTDYSKTAKDLTNWKKISPVITSNSSQKYWDITIPPTIN